MSLLGPAPRLHLELGGLTLGLEFAPGVDFGPNSIEFPRARFTFVASLCVGWATW